MIEQHCTGVSTKLEKLSNCLMSRTVEFFDVKLALLDFSSSLENCNVFENAYFCLIEDRSTLPSL